MGTFQGMSKTLSMSEIKGQMVRILIIKYEKPLGLPHKLQGKPINGLYCLAGNFFLNLSSSKYRNGKYRYIYCFLEFTSINSINELYDRYHLVKLDNCPYIIR